MFFWGQDNTYPVDSYDAPVDGRSAERQLLHLMDVIGHMTSSLPQVVLCENNIYSQGHMNDTLTHELVHAYDHCRAHMDWNNLQHVACTEVRPWSNLCTQQHSCMFTIHTMYIVLCDGSLSPLTSILPL